MGERNFKNGFKRIMLLFLKLSMLLFGAKMWGWKERKRIERIQET